MHVCMNVSMCGGAHMCVHMCVYVCVRAHLEMFVCIRSSVYGNIGETSKESLRLFSSPCICVSTSVCICEHVCDRFYLFICLRTSVSVSVYVCVCVCVCMNASISINVLLCVL